MVYKALVFDFFGVICSEVAPFWLARHMREAAAAEVKSRIVHAADVGEISQEAMFCALSEMTRVPAAQVEAEWWTEVKIDTEVVELLKQLKGQYRLGLLTNSPSPFVRAILERHKLEAFFEAIVVSSEVGRAKPDPEIYALVLAELDVVPDETLFIDDNPANVVGAAAAGIQGIVFRTGSELAEELRHLGAL